MRSCAPSRTRSLNRQPLPRQAGATLIELMVGMLIGLLSTIVITQVMAISEAQKRSTTSGSDAQVNGALALYTLQRDVQMSGYGMTASTVGLGCKIKSLNFTVSNRGDRYLVPVMIKTGASGAPDTIRVFSSSKNSFSVPIRITGDHPTSGTGSDAFAVSNNMGVTNGDLMVAVPTDPVAKTCTLFRANGASSSTLIYHEPGDTGAWNGTSASELMSVFPNGGYESGSYLVNIGTAFIDRSYSITSRGAMRFTEFDTAKADDSPVSDVFPQIVNLKAFYGKDTNNDGAIDVYNTTTPTTAADWAQVLAVRVALVARSGQYEKEEVTPSAPVWNLGGAPAVTGSTTCGTSQCLSLKVNADMPTGDDWKHYRYKIYDTVIPLRNQLWRS